MSISKVMAAMDEAIYALGYLPGADGVAAKQALTEARAKLADLSAELIAAASEIQEHAQHHPDCSLVENGIDGDCWCGFLGSAERLDAALAKVQP